METEEDVNASESDENEPKGDSFDENRAGLRLRYRELLNEAEQEEACSLSDLTTKLNEMRNLFHNVSSTRELAMDSGLLSQYAAMGTRNAQNLDTNIVTFNATEFASLGSVFMRSDQVYSEEDDCLTPQNWLEFGKKATCLFKRCPPNIFLLGTLPKDENRQRKRRAPRAKLQVEATHAAPEKMSSMGKSDQEMTTEEVERILALLRYTCQICDGSVCFFEFVTDPNSFTRTVENIFHLSFLIKDGYVKLKEDDDHLLILEINSENSIKEGAVSKDKCEAVLSITQKQWKEIVQVYNIHKAVIEPRAAAV